MATQTPLLYVGVGSFVVCLNADTGEEVWRTKLPRAGVGGLVTITGRGPRLYVGSSGRAYCLDRWTGELVWQNGLPGTGYGAVLLALEAATLASAGDAAVADHVRRRQQAAAAGAAGAAAAT